MRVPFYLPSVAPKSASHCPDFTNVNVVSGLSRIGRSSKPRQFSPRSRSGADLTQWRSHSPLISTTRGDTGGRIHPRGVSSAVTMSSGSSAVHTLWQIGAFLSPYVWGVTKDATGSFRAALIGASVVVVVEALVILYVRARVMSERRLRAAAIEQPLAVRRDFPRT